MTDLHLASWLLGFLLNFNLVCGQHFLELVEENDIPYVSQLSLKNDSLQCLNLVYPKGETQLPLLVWIGGGAWSYGDRHEEMRIARAIAMDGICVASVDHRHSPAIWRDSSLNTGVQHPEHVKDIAKSIKWLKENAANFPYEFDKLFIGGYSSGAHLAALLVLDSTYLWQEGIATSVFKGVIPVSGTYDIQDYYSVMLNGNQPALAELHVEAVFGENIAAFKHASPVNFLENLSAPMLIMSDLSLRRYTKLFEDKIIETGFEHAQFVYHNELNHGAFWKNLSEPSSNYRKKIVQFIKRNSLN